MVSKRVANVVEMTCTFMVSMLSALVWAVSVTVAVLSL